MTDTPIEGFCRCPESSVGDADWSGRGINSFYLGGCVFFTGKWARDKGFTKRRGKCNPRIGESGGLAHVTGHRVPSPLSNVIDK